MTEYPLPQHETWKIHDSSKIRQAMDCLRQYLFRYVFGWEPETPNVHLVFGDALHRAMEHILLHGYGKESMLEASTLATKVYRESFPEPQMEEINFPKVPGGLLQLLIAYTQKYPENEFKVLYTEVAGTVIISENRYLHYRLDALVQNSEGIWVLEHKSTGGYLNEKWTMQFNQSIQPGTYNHAANCIFDTAKVRGVIINGMMIRRPTKKDAAEGLIVTTDFMRVPLRKQPVMMNDWLWTANHWVDWIEFEFERLSTCKDLDPVLACFPKNPESCTKYFGCPYYHFCTVWPNPLQHCQVAPPGYQVRWWDPAAREATASHVMHLKPKEPQDGGSRELSGTNTAGDDREVGADHV